MIILANSTNSNNSLGFWIFLGIMAVTLFFIIIFYIINKKLNERVTTTSEYLKKIKEINKEINFKTIFMSSDTKTFYLNSKRAFDNFDFYKRKEELIRDNFNYYEQIVNNINFNVETLKEYDKKIKNISLTSDEKIAKENKMSLNSYNKREIKLGFKLIKHPCTSYKLRVEWQYTSPAGRNHYYNYRDLSFGEVKSMVSLFKFSNRDELKMENEPRYQHSSPRVYTNDDIEDID